MSNCYAPCFNRIEIVVISSYIELLWFNVPRIFEDARITELSKHLPSVKVNLNSSFGGGP